VNFLELCQAYRAELGIPGSGPTTVVGQTGELGALVADVVRAEVDIKRRWQDWDFMWSAFTSNTVIGSRTPSTSQPTDLGVWDVSTFALSQESADYIELDYLPYKEFRQQIVAAATVTGTADIVTFDPTGDILLDPQPDAVLPFYGEYWRRADEMTADIEISRIPVAFHRLIIVRAKIHYAEREDAPELTAGAMAEFEDLLRQLESHSLPGHASSRQYQNTEFASVMAV